MIFYVLNKYSQDMDKLLYKKVLDYVLDNSGRLDNFDTLLYMSKALLIINGMSIASHLDSYDKDHIDWICINLECMCNELKKIEIKKKFKLING